MGIKVSEMTPDTTPVVTDELYGIDVASGGSRNWVLGNVLDVMLGRTQVWTGINTFDNVISLASNTINPADAGVVRLAVTDLIAFRDFDNNSNITIGINGVSGADEVEIRGARRFYFIGGDGQTPFMGIRAFGANPQIIQEKALGTEGTPLVCVDGTVIAANKYAAFDSGTSFKQVGQIRMTAAELHVAATAFGADMEFFTMDKGAVAHTEKMTLGADGDLAIRQGNKLFLDGIFSSTPAGDTSIGSPSSNIVRIEAGGADYDFNATTFNLNSKTITNGSIATSLLTGILADARMPNLTGNVTTVEGAVATTIVSCPTSALTGIIADARMPNLTGPVTTVQGAVATTIINNAITLAMMAHAVTQGSIITFNGTGETPSYLTPGTEAQVLTAHGTANLTWEDAGGATEAHEHSDLASDGGKLSGTLTIVTIGGDDLTLEEACLL